MRRCSALTSNNNLFLIFSRISQTPVTDSSAGFFALCEVVGGLVNHDVTLLSRAQDR